MEPIPDFSHLRHFPGSVGGEFDVVLRKLDELEKIPALLFAGILLLIAIPPTLGHWVWTFGLWAFFLADWLLLALLPRLQHSFGPPKPTTLILAILRMGFAFLPFPASIVLQGIGTLLVIAGFWIEPHRLTVTRQSLTSDKLKPGQPVRILHIGDLHVERITRRERRLNRYIQELKPDLIVFSGDIINLSYVEDPVAWEQARQVLSEWRAPCGVYVVPGSPAVDLEHVFPHLVEGLHNLHWLRDERLTVHANGQEIDLVGMTCTHKPFVDGPILEKLVQPPTGNFTLLVYHTPDLAPNAANTGQIDLQVSGHTHGGQIRLPGFGAIFAASLYGKRFESGRVPVGDMTVYITRGIGMEGKAAPRVRLFCPPEVILWEIDGE